MSTLLAPAPPARPPAPPSRTRFRLSVDDYEQMVKFGILTEDDRVELIRGEIIEKMPIGDPHASCVDRSNRYFNHVPGDVFIVRIQNPVRLVDSVPEPDVMLVRWRDDFYRNGKPKAADIVLIIEVSDSTLSDDRDVKGPLYAENGIADYWILNLVDECLEVRRGPRTDGTYADVAVYRRGQSVAPLFDPTLVVAVDDLI